MHAQNVQIKRRLVKISIVKTKKLRDTVSALRVYR